MDIKLKGGYTTMTGWTTLNHPEYDRGFRNGQQSKQAEIDALQKRINDTLDEIESGITGKYHIKSIIKILKGASE